MITVVIGKIIHGVEVDGEMMMGLSIYGVAVMVGRYTPDSTVFHVNIS